MSFFKTVFNFFSTIFIIFVMTIITGIIVDKVFLPNETIIVEDNLKFKAKKRIDINLTKISNETIVKTTFLLKNPKNLCDEIVDFIHVNKKINCKFTKINNYISKPNFLKNVTSIFQISKGNGLAELIINAEIKHVENINQIISIHGNGEIQLLKMPNYFFEYLAKFFDKKIGGNFIYNLKLVFNPIKNGTKINITGYIEYGINFMPTFVYMPAEIINRFGNQIINDILDYVIRKI
jgi:hypothetical protein